MTMRMTVTLLKPSGGITISRVQIGVADHSLSGAVVGSRIVMGVAVGHFASVRQLFDTIAASEIVTFNVGKAATDLGLVADTLAAAVGLVLSDSAAASDVLTLGVGLSRTDAATVADALALTVGPNLVDATSTTDTLTKAVSTVLADSAATADSGLVVVQNYVDPSYLAADYVGEARTF